MRQLSERRMKRWLERKTEATRRGKRYGLIAMSIPAPEAAHGKEWLAGEAIPHKLHLLPRMAFLVPLRMTITRVGEGYPWWRLRWNRLGKQELTMHARSELLRARGRRELEREGEDLDGEIADFLTSKARRRVTVSGRGGLCR